MGITAQDAMICRYMPSKHNNLALLRNDLGLIRLGALFLDWNMFASHARDQAAASRLVRSACSAKGTMTSQKASE